MQAHGHSRLQITTAGAGHPQAAVVLGAGRGRRPGRARSRADRLPWDAPGPGSANTSAHSPPPLLKSGGSCVPPGGEGRNDKQVPEWTQGL